MSIDLDQLYKASYKQVDFLVTGSGIRGGRKSVLHQYPNSNNQTVEDLGALQRSYSLTAVITGDNYFENRNALLSAIEEGGPGVLIHPFYGEIENIVARNYSINENLNSLGAATISINFDIDTSQSTPVATSNTVSELNSIRDSALDSVASDIENGWNVSTSLNNSFEYARDKLNEFSNAYESAMEPIRSVTDNVNNLTSLIDEFNYKIVELTLSPQELSTSFKNLFTSANSLSQTASVAVDSFEDLFGFGDSTDDEIVEDAGFVKTASNLEKTNNKRTLDAATNQMALAQAYVNYAQIEYSTTEEIDAVVDLLKKQSEIEQNEYSSTDTKDVMKDLQIATFNFLDELRDSARSIIEIQQNSLTSSRLLSYKAYGDSSFDSEINDANNIKDVSFVSGNLRILSE